MPDGFHCASRRDGQRRRRRQHQRAMDDPLPAPREPRQHVRVGIAREEHDLEKQHARRPHPRTAAEPRQDELADDRLHLEEQEGAQQREDAELQRSGEARGRMP